MAALRLGAIGDAVRQVQAGLNLLPTQLLRLKIDGIFGVRTQGRVLEFQRFNRIVQDGVVGDITLGLIETLLRNLGLWPPPDPGPGPSAGAVRPINNEMVGMTGLGNLYEQILPSRMMVDMTSYVRNSDGNVFRFRPIPMMVCRAGIFAARKGDMERVVILVLPRDVKADRLCICITQGFGQAAADLNKLGWSNPLSKPFVEFALLKHVVKRYAPQVIASKKNMGLLYILRANQGSHELGPFATDGAFTLQVLQELVALTNGAFSFDAVEAFTYSSGISDFNPFLASLKGRVNIAGTYNIDPAQGAEAGSGGGFRVQFLSGQTTVSKKAGFEWLPHPRWRNESFWEANERNLFDYLHNYVMPNYCLNVGIELT